MAPSLKMRPCLQFNRWKTFQDKSHLFFFKEQGFLYGSFSLTDGREFNLQTMKNHPHALWTEWVENSFTEFEAFKTGFSLAELSWELSKWHLHLHFKQDWVHQQSRGISSRGWRIWGGRRVLRRHIGFQGARQIDWEGKSWFDQCGHFHHHRLLHQKTKVEQKDVCWGWWKLCPQLNGWHSNVHQETHRWNQRGLPEQARSISKTLDPQKTLDFSEIPLHLSLHCIQLSDVPDGETNQQTLREFSSRGRSSDRWNLLRMSADVAILLVDSYSDFANCGSNYFWALQSGKTLGTVSRSCIIKYVPTISFTFHVSPVLLTRLLTDLVSPTISWRHQTETQSTTTQRATLMLSWVIFLGI